MNASPQRSPRDPGGTGSRNLNLADAIREHAHIRPTHSAIEFRGKSVSYAALDRAVDAAAARLIARGIVAGDHVGIGLSDRPEHLVYLFATARLGAAFVPIDCRWTDSEKLRVCDSFDVKLLATDEALAEERIPTLRVPPAEIDLPTDPPAAMASSQGDPQVLAIYLSSGTTGKPKGPVLTHENMRARFGIYAEHLNLSSNDRYACVTPLYFSAGRGLAMCMLYLGGTIVMLPTPTPAQELIESINETRCTITSLVPTMIRRLLAAADGRQPALPGLRTLISTGAALNKHEREAAMHRLSPFLYTFYGASEGGGASVLSPDHPPHKADSAGQVLKGTQVRIVNGDGEDMPSGEIGRICYRSKATSIGYYRDPDATAITFRDGWFHPGDLGRIDDGFIYITGREKDMILRGGANVYPEEIERALRSHPAMSDVAVVGAPSREFGEEIVAFVALALPVADQDLSAWCRKELAPYKVPRRFVRLEEIPKTSIGKADKATLRDRARADAHVSPLPTRDLPHEQ